MITEIEFTGILKYIQDQMEQWEGVYDVHNIPQLKEFCTYSGYKEVRKVKGKKVDSISKDIEGYFMAFWEAFPSKSAFEYKEKKFAGERALKCNKQVCLRLYSECIDDMRYSKINMTGIKAVELILKAMKVQVEHIKIESYKSGQNRMQYMSSIEVYLRQKKYEAFLGEPMPEEDKKYNVTVDTMDI